jgi:hypothetical protein
MMSEKYSIWLICEFFGIKPLGVADSWNECDVDTQASLIAYSQICECE